ncbi:hypothetical protein [Candidatus Spongiihabitans sp.]|uniref:hypothetical protein n=1 Tax=Candidatus Spongiihabitans sp. TaxID=3101308 RepID=UPI003C7BA080
MPTVVEGLVAAVAASASLPMVGDGLIGCSLIGAGKASRPAPTVSLQQAVQAI